MARRQRGEPRGGVKKVTTPEKQTDSNFDDLGPVSKLEDFDARKERGQDVLSQIRAEAIRRMIERSFT